MRVFMVPGGHKVTLDPRPVKSPPKGHPWKWGGVAMLMASDRPGQRVQVVSSAFDEAGVPWVVVKRSDGQLRAVPVAADWIEAAN